MPRNTPKWIPENKPGSLEAYRDIVIPYRRRLKLVALLDIITAVGLCFLYTMEILYISCEKGWRLEGLDYWLGLVIVIVHGVLTLCFNLIQISGARQLIKGIELDKSDPTFCIQSTELWLRICAFFSIALLLKGIVFIFITYAIRDKILRIFWLSNIFAIALEVSFRSIGCHYARKFLKKLPIIRTTRITSYNQQIVTSV